MRLSFPNPSRSFDATTNRARLWGYDNAIEVSFLVEEGVLVCQKKKGPWLRSTQTFGDFNLRLEYLVYKNG